MEYRRASSLLFMFKGDKFVCYNFLTRQRSSVEEKVIPILERFEDYADLGCFLSAFPGEIQTLAYGIRTLIDNGILLERNSKKDIEDDLYRKTWTWGSEAGFYHYSVKNTKFDSPKLIDGFLEKLERKINSGKNIPVIHRNIGHYKLVKEYKKPNLNRGILKIMSRRRTVRSFDQQKPVLSDELMSVLFSGLGILHFRHIEPSGLLPLKMTPSGGARNPFDAIIYCAHVAGLKPGFYHYSPIEHSLGFIDTQTAVLPSAILGQQYWADQAAAVIFLMANLERTMFKYEHYAGYRAVFIEAGHIAQNCILTANDLGFHAATTAATHDPVFEQAIGSTHLLHSCIYAIALGHLGANKNLLLQ